MSNYREDACDACNQGTLDVNPCTCDSAREADQPDVQVANLDYFRGVAESYLADEEWGDVMQHVLDLHAALVASEQRLATAQAVAIGNAADAIQALHLGEVKNSVIFLRDFARRYQPDAAGTESDIRSPEDVLLGPQGYDAVEAVLSLMDGRLQRVEEWPADEAALYRQDNWHSFDERFDAVSRLRAEKIVKAVVAVYAPLIHWPEQEASDG